MRTPQLWLWSSAIVLIFILWQASFNLGLFLIWCLWSVTFVARTKSDPILLLVIVLSLTTIKFVQYVNTKWLKLAIFCSNLLMLYWYYFRSLENLWIVGAYAAFSLPLLLSISEDRPWIGIIIAIIPFIGVLVTLSTSAVLAAYTGIITFLIGKRRYLTLIVFLIISLCSTCFLPKSFYTDSFRIKTWEESLKKVRGSSMFIGTGLNTYKDYGIMEGIDTVVTHAHNEYLEVYCELGLAGLILLICFIIDLFLVQAPIEYKAMLGAIVVHSFFYYPARLACTGFLILICIGMIHKYKGVNYEINASRV